MRHRLFIFWCGICLLLTAALLAGYVLDMGVNIGRGSAARGEARQISLVAGRGRLRCFFAHVFTPVAPAQDGFYADGRVDVTKLRQMRFDVTGFDSHWLERPGNPGGTSLYLISCPLWFAMLVALASPAIWLIGRRRRRRRLQRAGTSAFAVIQPDGTK
jgi:hypothetical protein